MDSAASQSKSQTLDEHGHKLDGNIDENPSAQGKGGSPNRVQDASNEDVWILSDRVRKRLNTLETVSKSGKKAQDLFRFLENPDLWMLAYSNIHSNKGALTPGVSAPTMDGFSEERAINLIELLKAGQYRHKPVRRTQIPKSNGGKRPLGIPASDDKLVQEVCRIILERIYEPVFEDSSHGFRKGRSCHTTLKSIQRNWTGVKWIVNVDIKGYFDNINHSKLMEILSKKIDDKRFLKLIRSMLDAGYMEDWKYYKTYSGAPQGGIISPILSNIYLHELDSTVEGWINEFNKGKERAINPEYERIMGYVRRTRKKIRQIQSGKRQPKYSDELNDLLQQFRELRSQYLKLQSKDPYDANYRRLLYCRYADDFMFGIIGSREDASTIFLGVKKFLEQELCLQTSAEKSKILYASKGTIYLGYQIRVETGNLIKKFVRNGIPQQSRVFSQRMVLRVPREKVKSFCQSHKYGDFDRHEAKHLTNRIHRSDIEIIRAYNSELRGFAEYYKMACDVKKKLDPLQHLWRLSLYKTLANKHKSSVDKIAKRLRTGHKYGVSYSVNGKKKFEEVYSLAKLKSGHSVYANIDVKVNTGMYTYARTELVSRLNANRCEYCGKTGGYFEVHHVRKLTDLTGKKPWEQTMSALNRKTLVLCNDCHVKLHHGTLPPMKRI